MLKNLRVFKEFVIQFVSSLTMNEREAFRHWCIGKIPESKLDVNVSNDGEMFRIIEFLCNDLILSLTDLSLLRKFLSIVGRFDMLETLERVESRIYVGIIVEDYINMIKCVNEFGQGVCIKMASRYTNIVKFLFTTSKGNEGNHKQRELISSSLEVSKKVNENSKMLEAFDSAFLNSQLSWSTIVSSLVIVGELYASFSPVESAENGYYLSMFSETRASECLPVWMIENGGLVS